MSDDGFALSAEDRATLDQLIREAVAEIGSLSAEIPDEPGADETRVELATVRVVERLSERAKAGDAQARRLNRYMAIKGTVEWLEEEAAAGRLVWTAEEAKRRLMERRGKPRPA